LVRGKGLVADSSGGANLYISIAFKFKEVECMIIHMDTEEKNDMKSFIFTM
jgi:hypothetical protein